MFSIPKYIIIIIITPIIITITRRLIPEITNPYTEITKYHTCYDYLADEANLAVQTLVQYSPSAFD